MTLRYVLGRIVSFVATIIVAATLNFALTHLTPQDPIAALMGRLASRGRSVEGGDQMIALYRERFGLDKPIYIQYVDYMENLLLHGDMGYSLSFFPAKAQDVILGAIKWTMGLFTISTIISFTLGNLLGALAAWPKTPRHLKNLIFITIPFSAIPYYLLALILVYLFAINIPIFPLSGSFTVGSTRGFTWETFIDLFHHSILPILSMVLAVLGFWALSMRGVMTTIIGEDFLIYARVRGLVERRIFSRYAVRNALLPQVTALAIDLGGMMSGQVLVEIIFNYPGIGWVLYNALRTADYLVIQGVVLFMVGAVALATLILDLVYPLLDPRIRY